MSLVRLRLYQVDLLLGFLYFFKKSLTILNNARSLMPISVHGFLGLSESIAKFLEPSSCTLYWHLCLTQIKPNCRYCVIHQWNQCLKIRPYKHCKPKIVQNHYSSPCKTLHWNGWLCDFQKVCRCLSGMQSWTSIFDFVKTWSELDGYATLEKHVDIYWSYRVCQVFSTL